eukprot:Blabericola_migrator_1__4559@NODE_2426_length_2782_cov_458_464825_g1519_i0_p3_GENE_NODE_2426_length_2782_cov_458_464825_g1519_i0NODE_2426_length_2782_cov_458_464825_g1519_i0_p3_ORF_typecomplete_len121_score1_67PTS_EIIC_2/PF13303_6/0_077_NODE_2426_length_2782_cov_458_464825_g1519_i054416
MVFSVVMTTEVVCAMGCVTWAIMVAFASMDDNSRPRVIALRANNAIAVNAITRGPELSSICSSAITRILTAITCETSSMGVRGAGQKVVMALPMQYERKGPLHQYCLLDGDGVEGRRSLH